MTEDASDSGDENEPDGERTAPPVDPEESDPNGWAARGRLVLADHLAVAVLGLAILGLVGTGLVYAAHVDPGTTTERVVEASWEERGEFAHRAEVQQGTAVFDAGEVLENRSTYYTGVAPHLEGSYEYRYAAADGEVDARVELDLVVRSTQDGEVLWEQTEPLDDERVEGLAPGEPIAVDFAVNASEVASRIERIERELGASPGEPEAFVRATVTTEGRVAGDAARTSHTNHLNLSPSGETYTVESGAPHAETHERVTQRTVEQEPGLLTAVGGPLLMLLSVVGLGAVAFLWRAGRLVPSPAERRRFRRQREREEFDDWITVGRLPAAIDDRPRVAVDSLEGLVDVAIDSNSRVVEDRRRDAFYVVDDPVYVYDPDRDLAVAGEPDPDEDEPQVSSPVPEGGPDAGTEVVADGTGEPER